MAGFPWSELGLDGPADERSIRRAYAARLKIVRPDVDPAGFQRLVQARDIALRAIAQRAPPPPPQSPPANPTLIREPPAIPREPPPPPAPAEAKADGAKVPQLVLDLGKPGTTAETDQRTTRPPRNMPVTIEIELSSGQSAPEAEPRPAPPPEPPPVTTDTDAPRPSSPSSGAGGQRNDALPAPRSKVSGPEAVSTLLAAFMDAWISNAVLPPPAPILSLLVEQSIAARTKLESDILRAVATLFANGLFDQTTPSTRRQAAASLIQGFDDDYAWTSSDRRLYQMMPQPVADQLLRQLRALRGWTETGQMTIGRIPDVAAPGRAKSRQRGASAAFELGAMILVSIIRAVSLFGGKPTPPPVAIPNITEREFLNPTAQASYALSFFNQGAAYDRTAQFDFAIQQ